MVNYLLIQVCLKNASFLLNNLNSHDTVRDSLATILHTISQYQQGLSALEAQAIPMVDDFSKEKNRDCMLKYCGNVFSTWKSINAMSDVFNLLYLNLVCAAYRK